MKRWLAGLVLGCAAATVCAQTAYPVKPVRLIVAFPAGGGSDVLARALAQQMGEPLGQTVVIDNRPGAAGIIGTELAAKAPPDGYTLLVGSSSALTINPHIHRKLPYDPIGSFAAVGMFASHSYVISVHPSVPAKSMKELIGIARAKPGNLNFGSAGYGSSAHLATELFMMMSGVRMSHIPYKGQAQSLIGLMGGEIDILWDAVITTLPHVKSGRLRPLAVSKVKRSSLLPQLPTVSESGVPNYEASNWFGIFAPAGLAKPIVGKLNTSINQSMTASQLKEQLFSQGAEPLTGTPEDLDALLKRDLAKFAKIIKESGAKVE
jgi:tripartite-type tricarboxylate transporter receptor subunit TctC